MQKRWKTQTIIYIEISICHSDYPAPTTPSSDLTPLENSALPNTS